MTTSNDSSAPAASSGSSRSRFRVLACFALTLAAVQITVGTRARFPQWSATGNNLAVAEAKAWLDGRLDLEFHGVDPLTDRPNDTALYNGRVYNFYPPLFTFLSLANARLNALLGIKPDF